MIPYQVINVKADGSMEELSPDKKSFNSRRVLLIQDPFERKIWIYKGKSSAKTTRSMGEIKAKELNGKLGFQFSIEEVNNSDKDAIDQFLQKSEKESDLSLEKLKVKEGNGKKTKKQRKMQKVIVKKPEGIPKAVAPKKGKGGKVVPKGDLEKEGPMIEEFQIAFSGETPDFGGLISFMEILDRLIKSGSSKEVAEKELKEALKSLIDTYFVK